MNLFSRLTKRFTAQSGLSLVETLAATAVLTIAGGAMLGVLQVANQDSALLRSTRIVVTARSHIEAALKNPAAWRQTVALNSSFACAGTGGCSLSSAPDGYYDFVLYGVTAGEKLTYDATDSTTRYALQGGACPVSTADPSPQCPMKYVAKWKPLCSTYPCKQPTLDIKVSLVLEFGSSSAPILNARKYDYTAIRNIDDGSLQSACQILNGTYNSVTGTCYPKNAGASCVALGKPAQIVTGVASDGTITCSPLYTGLCDASSQVMNGISSTGVAQCAPKTQPPNCPVNCVGAWSNCSSTCGPGTETYNVITPAANGGAACTLPAPGATRPCTGTCPTNCVGSWSGCSQPCGTGIDRYSITTPASGGGAACPTADGTTIQCNTQACGAPVDCAGSWGACDPTTGTKTFTVTQAPQNGGAACPSPLTQNCPVDCVGSWGSCAGGFKTYTWTTLPRNGGSTATCAYPNGQTDSAACAPAVNCVGSWGSCTPVTACSCSYNSCFASGGTQTYTITTPASGAGTACPNTNGEVRACALHSWGILFPQSPGHHCSWGMSCIFAGGCGGGAGNPGSCCPLFAAVCTTPGAITTCPGFNQVTGSGCSSADHSIITLQCF
jgi:Tfp pilus assembly protein PilV